MTTGNDYILLLSTHYIIQDTVREQIVKNECNLLHEQMHTIFLSQNYTYTDFASGVSSNLCFTIGKIVKVS